jgi:hypothetical protein
LVVLAAIRSPRPSSALVISRDALAWRAPNLRCAVVSGGPLAISDFRQLRRRRARLERCSVNYCVARVPWNAFPVKLSPARTLSERILVLCTAIGLPGHGQFYAGILPLRFGRERFWNALSPHWRRMYWSAGNRDRRRPAGGSALSRRLCPGAGSRPHATKQGTAWLAQIALAVEEPPSLAHDTEGGLTAPDHSG